jgi:hypothetical protein
VAELSQMAQNQECIRSRMQKESICPILLSPRVAVFACKSRPSDCRYRLTFTSSNYICPAIDLNKMPRLPFDGMWREVLQKTCLNTYIADHLHLCNNFEMIDAEEKSNPASQKPELATN